MNCPHQTSPLICVRCGNQFQGHLVCQKCERIIRAAMRANARPIPTRRSICFECAKDFALTARWFASNFCTFQGFGSTCDFCGKDKGSREVAIGVLAKS